MRMKKIITARKTLSYTSAQREAIKRLISKGFLNRVNGRVLSNKFLPRYDEYGLLTANR